MIHRACRRAAALDVPEIRAALGRRGEGHESQHARAFLIRERETYGRAVCTLDVAMWP
jgi:hypothetical protein